MESTKRNQQGRPSGSGITAVDIVVFILVLALLGGTVFGWVYASMKEDDAAEASYTYVVTFRIAKTHRAVLDGLAGGDALYDASKGGFVGYLRDDLQVITAREEAAVLNRVTGEGSMICVGRMGETDKRTLYIDGRTLTPGEELRIRTDREVLTVRILAITEVMR